MIYKLSGRSDGDHPAFVDVPLATLKDAGWREKDLEDYLAQNITKLLREDQLMVISQERRGQEAPDALALDAQGVLYIFELKRWEGRAENLLQVLRYGQLFGIQPYADLDAQFRRYSAEDVSLQVAHQRNFELEQPLPLDHFNHKQHFVLVMAGNDMATLDAIAYWKGQGLPISSLTYHVYSEAGAHYLEWHAFSPAPDDYAAVVSRDFVVNTNATYDPDAYLDMLGDGNTGKAAAYGTRKSAVDGITQGSTVFLYHTGVGIIARGRAMDTYRVKDFRGESGQEHYVPLKFDPPVDPADPFRRAVPAYAVNEKLQTSHRFRQTAFRITADMAKAIEELLVARSAD